MSPEVDALLQGVPTAEEKARPMPEFRFQGACACGWVGPWHENSELPEGLGPVRAEDAAWSDISVHCDAEHKGRRDQARCDSEAKA